MAESRGHAIRSGPENRRAASTGRVRVAQLWRDLDALGL